MRPRKTIRLGAAAFGDEISCLGWQFVALLRAIEELDPNLTWYAADVQTIGPSPTHRRDPTPALIGNATALMQAGQLVEQFESGVFVGVPLSCHRPSFSNRPAMDGLRG
jgi:hypothetical protein